MDYKFILLYLSDLKSATSRTDPTWFNPQLSNLKSATSPNDLKWSKPQLGTLQVGTNEMETRSSG